MRRLSLPLSSALCTSHSYRSVYAVKYALPAIRVKYPNKLAITVAFF
jgi:hypothetical protein